MQLLIGKVREKETSIGEVSKKDGDCLKIELLPSWISREHLYGDQFFTDEMQADDSGAGLFLEVTYHRIANHFIQFFEGLGHSKNGLAEGFGCVAAFRWLAHDEDDFVHGGTSLKIANRRRAR